MTALPVEPDVHDVAVSYHGVSPQTVVCPARRILATRGALRLSLRLRETANVLADLARRIH
jgi:hypothetical protein